MEKYRFKLSKNHAQQLKQYLNSPTNEFSYLKSRLTVYGDGWRTISVDGNMVDVTDQSGLDLDTNYLNNLGVTRVYDANLIGFLRAYLVSSKEVAKAIVYRLLEIIKSGTSSGMNGYKKHYQNIWDSCGGIKLGKIKLRHHKLHYERLLAYNYFNELSPYIDKHIVDQKLSQLRVLEIGPGVGNLALVFAYHQMRCPNKYYLIDLQEALPFSISHLMYHFPESQFILPNEMNEHLNYRSDKSTFVFLTPEQASDLEANTFDVAVNTNSFAEMPTETIKEYFQVFRRVLKKENVALIVNRAEKAMDLKDHTAVDTRFASERIYREGDKNYQINRFAEYPWSSKDRIFAYHMSPFNMSRTTQNFFLKVLQMDVIDNSSEC